MRMHDSRKGMKMNMDDFKSLSKEEQLSEVLNSTYLTSRIENNCVVNLYLLDDLFVEEFYDSRSNTVVRLRPSANIADF